MKYKEVLILKNFLILHYGFEKPTSEDIAAWKQWFKSIADIQVDRGGLRDGRAISSAGTNNLESAKNPLRVTLLLKQATLMKQNE